MLFRDRAEELLARADVKINGHRPWDIQVHDPDFLFWVFRDGTLGLGESYMEGWWDCENLPELFRRVHGLADDVGEGMVGRWLKLRDAISNLQTVARARIVAQQHYNFGNEVFEATLGRRTMAYTCGYWANAATLDEAQEAKFDLICRKLRLQPEQILLDIGCGWGKFARFAAVNYGVRVVGITNSDEQFKYATAVCKGLAVNILKRDYRELTLENWFDAVVVCGMIEHVGRKNHRALMEAVHRVLKPDGLFLLHTIGNNQSRRVTDPWINRYIFPNGLIPSEAQIMRAKEGLFTTHDLHNFGPDYDPTLVAWCENFDRNWSNLQDANPVKYDERFRRMWRYYLLSCAGVFRAGGLQLWQYVFSKQILSKRYQAVR